MTDGEVVSIDADICRGWAKIATLPRYAVTVHLVLDNTVQASAIADRGATASDDPSVLGDCWFEIEVPAKAAGRVVDCRVLVGESGNYLSDIKRESSSDAASPASIQAPASFRDALDRGLSASDVVELLYLDILRRPADKVGLRSRLSELENGRESLESFRRALLGSEEYRRLSLRTREAPGGTFANRIIYSSSTRRLQMERHAAVFQRLDTPLRSKLLDFLPGLVALPDAIEGLVQLADKGLPQREIFFRALSALSHRPSLIVADRREHACDRDGEVLSNADREITLPCASPLFIEGWNRLERSSTKSFRWMEQVGILLNPLPKRRIEQLEIRADGWYGDLDQTITAIAGDKVLACERREAEGGGATLVFSPLNGETFTAPRIALVAGGAACPWRYDGTPDMRLLSCQVTAARFQYDGEAA